MDFVSSVYLNKYNPIKASKFIPYKNTLNKQ